MQSPSESSESQSGTWSLEVPRSDTIHLESCKAPWSNAGNRKPGVRESFRAPLSLIARMHLPTPALWMEDKSRHEPRDLCGPRPRNRLLQPYGRHRHSITRSLTQPRIQPRMYPWKYICKRIPGIVARTGYLGWSLHADPESVCTSSAQASHVAGSNRYSNFR
ncbi:hypothetical protein BJY01DRAFT_228000 [Aspergillus pseudoustus]|uniref:Uncharacterized protein n=1 Tax=Aspergillus pseudoustus TaxID=1810923 RepID=A0ABR4INI9_9EURO